MLWEAGACARTGPHRGNGNHSGLEGVPGRIALKEGFGGNDALVGFGG